MPPSRCTRSTCWRRRSAATAPSSSTTAWTFHRFFSSSLSSTKSHTDSFGWPFQNARSHSHPAASAAAPSSPATKTVASDDERLRRSAGPCGRRRCGGEAAEGGGGGGGGGVGRGWRRAAAAATCWRARSTSDGSSSRRRRRPTAPTRSWSPPSAPPAATRRCRAPPRPAAPASAARAASAPAHGRMAIRTWGTSTIAKRLDAEASVPTCENSAAPCLIHTRRAHAGRQPHRPQREVQSYSAPPHRGTPRRRRTATGSRAAPPPPRVRSDVERVAQSEHRSAGAAGIEFAAK